MYISVFAAAAYILLPQNLMKQWGSLVPIGVGMLSGGIAFFFLMRVFTLPLHFDKSTALITAVIVIIGTVFAFTMFLKGTSMIGPARGNMLGCVEPLTATLCSAFFIGTVFTGMDILGFAFIIATVFILAKK